MKYFVFISCVAASLLTAGSAHGEKLKKLRKQDLCANKSSAVAANLNQGANMRIKTIELCSQNPSLGTSNCLSKYWLDLKSEPDISDRLLSETKINDFCTLAEYIRALNQDDKVFLASFKKNQEQMFSNKDKIHTGGTQNKLSLLMESGVTFHFTLNESFYLNGYYKDCFMQKLMKNEISFSNSKNEKDTLNPGTEPKISDPSKIPQKK